MQQWKCFWITFKVITYINHYRRLFMDWFHFTSFCLYLSIMRKAVWANFIHECHNNGCDAIILQRLFVWQPLVTSVMPWVASLWKAMVPCPDINILLIKREWCCNITNEICTWLCYTWVCSCYIIILNRLLWSGYPYSSYDCLSTNEVTLKDMDKSKLPWRISIKITVTKSQETPNPTLTCLFNLLSEKMYSVTTQIFKSIGA